MRFPAALLLLTCAPACFAQASAWSSVQALTAGTLLSVRADHHSSTCTLDNVSDSELVCESTGTRLTYPRAEVRSIRLSGHSRSIARSTLVGAGVGLGGGILAGVVINAADKGSIPHVSEGKAIGVGAAIGVLAGTLGGLVVGASRHSPGPFVYTR